MLCHGWVYHKIQIPTIYGDGQPTTFEVADLQDLRREVGFVVIKCPTCVVYRWLLWRVRASEERMRQSRRFETGHKTLVPRFDSARALRVFVGNASPCHTLSQSINLRLSLIPLLSLGLRPGRSHLRVDWILRAYNINADGPPASESWTVHSTQFWIPATVCYR